MNGFMRRPMAGGGQMSSRPPAQTGQQGNAQREAMMSARQRLGGGGQMPSAPMEQVNSAQGKAQREAMMADVGRMRGGPAQVTRMPNPVQRQMPTGQYPNRGQMMQQYARQKLGRQ